MRSQSPARTGSAENAPVARSPRKRTSGSTPSRVASRYVTSVIASIGTTSGPGLGLEQLARRFVVGVVGVDVRVERAGADEQRGYRRASAARISSMRSDTSLLPLRPAFAAPSRRRRGRQPVTRTTNAPHEAGRSWVHGVLGTSALRRRGRRGGACAPPRGLRPAG